MLSTPKPPAVDNAAGYKGRGEIGKAFFIIFLFNYNTIEKPILFLISLPRLYIRRINYLIYGCFESVYKIQEKNIILEFMVIVD